MPVTEPSGANNKERPRLPSVKPSLAFIPGMAATHIPNNRLETANKKPTANAGLFFINEVKFLIIKGAKEDTNLHQNIYSHQQKENTVFILFHKFLELRQWFLNY